MTGTPEHDEATQVEDDDFDQWADERAREFNELEVDRFACGGWRCAGSHIPGF